MVGFVLLLLLAGFLGGGFYSFARTRKWIPAAVLGLATVLAVAAAIGVYRNNA